MEKYLINPNQKMSKINKDIYGHFCEHLGRCVYGGIYVGQDSPIPNVNGMRTDVVEALKAIRVPVLRWPGGCFADEYHWRDGVGPKESRKRTVFTHWGGFVEDNSFGTHEFFELCRQLGCDAYVNGNVGSGTVQEMSDWVEYMTFDSESPMTALRAANGQAQPWNVKYFGIGNENWGCGGYMSPEYYANEYKRYQTYARNYSSQKMHKIAAGAAGNDLNWTEVLMKTAAAKMDGLSLHYYTVPGDWEHKGDALEFTEEEYYTTIEKAYRMDRVIRQHGAIMDRYDPDKRIGMIIDEWGTWYDAPTGACPAFLYQQNTMRDAIVAGVTLNIFNKHSDRVKMANIAQMVNVLQSLILTDGEDMLLTPTYYVFKLFAEHADNALLGSYTTCANLAKTGYLPQLVESASVMEDGSIVSTIVNTSADASVALQCQIADFAVKNVKAEILTGEMHAHNTYENKKCVVTAPFLDVQLRTDGFETEIPPCAVCKFIIR